jgi:hypothetical protein
MARSALLAEYEDFISDEADAREEMISTWVETHSRESGMGWWLVNATGNSMSHCWISNVYKWVRV